MRNLAVFILVMVAIFLLLTDKKLIIGSGKGKNSGEPSSSSSNSSSSSVSSSDFNDPLSDEFKPQDLSKYSNIRKLNEDFDYRRSKLEFQQNEEVKEFIKTHDRYGKDKEVYDKMVKHHADLRKEFHDNRMKTLQNYQDGKLGNKNGNGDGEGEGNSEPINKDLR